jgi:hypothetical protein
MVEPTPKEEHRLRLGEVMVSVFVFVLVAVLVTLGVGYFQVREDVAATRENTETPSLVDDWVITAAPGQTVTLGDAEGIPLRGRFDCSDEAEAEDPIVQFKASLATAAPGGLEVPRPLRPPRNISRSCSPESGTTGETLFVEFTAPWEEAVVNALSAAVDAPTEFVMIFSVESPGWVGTSTVTGPFVVLPAEGSAEG